MAYSNDIIQHLLRGHFRSFPSSNHVAFQSWETLAWLTASATALQLPLKCELQVLFTYDKVTFPEMHDEEMTY